MRKIYIAITVICLALSVVLLIRARTARSRRLPAYTIDYKVTERDQSGAVTSEYEWHRLQSSSGNWKDVKVYSDGRVSTMVCDFERGTVFYVGKNRLMRVSACVPYLSETDDELRQSPRYQGQGERILGYDTVVISNPPETSYKSGALGGAILKLVINFPDGYNLTAQATSITPGEPEPHRIEYPKDLPVDDSFFEKRQELQRSVQK